MEHDMFVYNICILKYQGNAALLHVRPLSKQNRIGL
jgi:hypothetical protein